MVDVDSSASRLIFFMGGGGGGELGGHLKGLFSEKLSLRTPSGDACIRIKEGYISYGTEFQK